MSDKFNAVIQDIAIRHGVVLSKDDPILILQTMNNRLIEETQQAQATMLLQFREEMENISSQWKDDAKEKAEKVLNAALAGSKEAMSKLLQETTNGAILAMKKMISDSLNEVRELRKQNQRFICVVLVSSVIVLSSFLCLSLSL
jgi:hypothetical protein